MEDVLDESIDTGGVAQLSTDEVVEGTDRGEGVQMTGAYLVVVSSGEKIPLTAVRRRMWCAGFHCTDRQTPVPGRAATCGGVVCPNCVWLVTYPSAYEGFGNALLEAIYFKRPVVVNRYPVYNADIRPLGFEFIELDGFVDDAAVERTRELLKAPEQAKAMAEKNYAIAQEHFSLEVLERKLRELIANG